MLDAVDASLIPAAGWDMLAGYMDGRWQSYPAMVKRFPGRVIASIAVFATDDADILDCETGDATPAQCPGWADRQSAAGRMPILYCNAATVAAVRAAMGSARKWLWWGADWTGSPFLLAGSDATQWTNGTQYDQSLVTDLFYSTVAAQHGLALSPQAHLDKDVAAMEAALTAIESHPKP